MSQVNINAKITCISVYYGITLLLVVAELYKASTLVLVFKPLLIPCLFLLYLISSNSKSTWYIISLMLALGSNIFFISTNQKWMLFGILFFLLYRIASIITIIKISKKIDWLPLSLATIPFLFIFSWMINIMIPLSNPSFYPSVLNAIFISIFCGMGLSHYILNDNKQNSWLLISTLLFTFLVFLFLFENFYLSNSAFKPLSALVFSTAHFAFFKFMIEAENQTTIDLP